MEGQEGAVGRRVHVGLEVAVAQVDRGPEGRQRVLDVPVGRELRAPTMSQADRQLGARSTGGRRLSRRPVCRESRRMHSARGPDRRVRRARAVVGQRDPRRRARSRPRAGRRARRRGWPRRASVRARDAPLSRATTSSANPSTTSSAAGAERALAAQAQQRRGRARASSPRRRPAGPRRTRRRRRAGAASVWSDGPNPKDGRSASTTASARGSRRDRSPRRWCAANVGSWRNSCRHVRRVGQAELLALVDVGATGQRQHERRRRAGPLQAERAVGLRVRRR